jgi:AraC family transcriptional regulator, transcriptional activator FtrA
VMRTLPFTRSVSVRPGTIKNNATAGFSRMLVKVTSFLFPGRSGMMTVRGSRTATIVVDAGLGVLARAGTIIVPGWQPIEAKPSEALLAALKRAHARKARIASICNGVFVLAAAGVLDRRRATAHWANAEILAQKYPRIHVDPDVLYVDDGDILTSAGRAAGLDLCLHIIRRDHGVEVANRVARQFVIAPHREGGQAQFIIHPVRTERDPLTHVFDSARQHIDNDMSIDRLAAQRT